MHRFSHLWAVVGLGAVLFLSTGCHPSFDVTAQGQATVMGSQLPVDLNAFPGISNWAAFDISQQQDFKNNEQHKDHIDSVRTSVLTLSISKPAGGTFSFLDSIQFYVQLPNNEASKKVFAHKDHVPHDATTFNLDLDDVDLAEYVKADSMSITTSTTGRTPNADTTIDVKVVFDVTVHL